MAFNIGLSGLEVAQRQLDVLANNIANTDTTGFKQSRAQFANLFQSGALGVSRSAIGSGVQLQAVQQNFGQGALDTTGRDLDLGLSGSGFFTLSDAGSQVFSRAGSFTLDRDGFVVNPQGQRLQVFEALNPQGTAFQTGTLSDLQLNTTVSPPQATGQVSAIFNFSAAEAALGAGAIDPTNPATFNFSNSATIYDSLGNSHQATLYVRKVGNTQFDLNVRVDGTDLGTQTVSFDPTGQLTTAQPVTFPGTFNPGTGANPITLDYDLTGTTLFGSEFSLNELTQDGFPPGQVTGLEVSESGVIQARFSNGRTEAQGQVAVAAFNNSQGLEQVGNNGFAETFQSGNPQFGAPGTGLRGEVRSGTLETSNVELSEQLVSLIEAQRSFQANAQVIDREDQLTQTVINIGR